MIFYHQTGENQNLLPPPSEILQIAVSETTQEFLGGSTEETAGVGDEEGLQQNLVNDQVLVMVSLGFVTGQIPIHHHHHHPDHYHNANASVGFRRLLSLPWKSSFQLLNALLLCNPTSLQTSSPAVMSCHVMSSAKLGLLLGKANGFGPTRQ